MKGFRPEAFFRHLKVHKFFFSFIVLLQLHDYKSKFSQICYLSISWDTSSKNTGIWQKQMCLVSLRKMLLGSGPNFRALLTAKIYAFENCISKVSTEFTEIFAFVPPYFMMASILLLNTKVSIVSILLLNGLIQKLHS